MSSPCRCHSSLVDKVKKVVCKERDYAGCVNFIVPYKKIDGIDEVVLELQIKTSFLTTSSNIRNKTVKIYGIYCPFCGHKKI